jgi:adenosine kinase
LVTTLRAAEQFNKEHLSSSEVVELTEKAKFFYIGGFFLTHGVESAAELAKTASTAGKVLYSSYTNLHHSELFLILLRL